MATWRKEKIKYFVLAFSVAFLLFSLLFLSFMAMAHPNKESAPSSRSQELLSEVYEPGREDALTVLFIGSSGEAKIFLLAKFDPEGGKIPFSVLPPETGIFNNGRMEPLSEIYDYGGAGYTKEALSVQLGIPIDRYVRMNRGAFIASADAIGSVEFVLENDMVLREDGAEQILRGGHQLLDGRKAAMIFSSADSGEEGLNQISRLTAEIINQRMDIALSTVVDKVFEKVVNIVDTDISYKDYHDRKQAAEHLVGAGGEPAVILTPMGQWENGKSLFILSDTFLAFLAREMG